jgi:hypothetical protein
MCLLPRATLHSDSEHVHLRSCKWFGARPLAHNQILHYGP